MLGFSKPRVVTTGMCVSVSKELVFSNKHDANKCRDIMMNLIDISQNIFNSDRYIKSVFK